MKSPAPLSRPRNPAARTRRPTAAFEREGLEILSVILRKRWKRYRKALNRCQDRFSEKAIHDSRVETRRLSALVELLSGFLTKRLLDRSLDALKDYLDMFGDLRDTQVQMQTVAAMRKSFAAAKPFHEYLCKREARFARRTRKQIRRFRPDALAELVEECQRRFLARSEDMGRRRASGRLLGALNRAFHRICRLRAAVDPADTGTIHATRVAFKKFRYMLEALADYLPGVPGARGAAMRRYQGLMGEIQDAEVLLRTFQRFLRKAGKAPKSAGRMQAELRRRRERRIRDYLRGADRLFEFWSWRGPQSRGPGGRGASRET